MASTIVMCTILRGSESQVKTAYMYMYIVVNFLCPYCVGGCGQCVMWPCSKGRASKVPIPSHVQEQVPEG